VRFWDSSALVPLLVEEELSGALVEILLSETEFVTWWGTTVECTAAITRRERAGSLSRVDATQSFQRLHSQAKAWYQIEPGEAVRETAQRFLRVHDLRSADALQLAAAFSASEGKPSSLEFVCLDERLGTAAQREGFLLLDRSGLVSLDAEGRSRSETR
jgi:predicted nucleic acid-binding protein